MRSKFSAPNHSATRSRVAIAHSVRQPTLTITPLRAEVKFTQQSFEERLDQILTEFPIMDVRTPPPAHPRHCQSTAHPLT